MKRGESQKQWRSMAFVIQLTISQVASAREFIISVARAHFWSRWSVHSVFDVQHFQLIVKRNILKCFDARVYNVSWNKNTKEYL